MSFSHDPPNGGKAAIRSPLRLVHPAPPPKPRRRRGVARAVEDVFTDVEVARLRLAIGNARTRFGGWERLAEAMGVHHDTVRLAGVRHTLAAGVAYRFARTTGTTIEAPLASALRVSPGTISTRLRKVRTILRKRVPGESGGRGRAAAVDPRLHEAPGTPKRRGRRRA